MSLWNTLGAFVAPAPAGGAESIPLLIDRFQRATTDELKERQLKSMLSLSTSRDTHEELGKHIPMFMSFLNTEKENFGMICEVLQILRNIMDCPAQHDDSSYVELHNTEVMLRAAKDQNVATILNLTEDARSWVRLYSAQLLMALLKNQTSALQDAILKIPLGVVKIIEVLDDNREAIRNEALLLLTELSKDNVEIQKIMAFGQTFERLFDIIYKEGAGEGGIVVRDCLQLMIYLLQGNLPNQNHFKIINLFSKIPGLLVLQVSDTWILADDKQAILILALELISTLLSSLHEAQNLADNQNLVFKSGIIQSVTYLGLSKLNNPSVRSRALLTLSDCIRGNEANRTFLAGSKILTRTDTDDHTSPPEMALQRAITIVLNSRVITERVGAMHLLQSYLFDNIEGQVGIASTFIPPPTEEDEERTKSLGRQLISAFLTRSPSFASLGMSSNNSTLPPEVITSWFASNALSCILKDNIKCKQMIVGMPLEVPGNTNTTDYRNSTLFNKVCDRIKEADFGGVDEAPASKYTLVRVGTLRLLCYWLYQAPTIIKPFRSDPDNIPFLVQATNASGAGISVHERALCALLLGICLCFQDEDREDPFRTSDQNTQTRSALHSLIVQQITVDKYISVLDAVRKTEAFIFAEQDRSLLSSEAIIQLNRGNDNNAEFELINKLYYDYDFVTLYKDVYEKTIRLIRAPYERKRPMTSRPSMTDVKRPGNNSNNTTTYDDEDGINKDEVISNYKKLIQDQDVESVGLKKQVSALNAKIKELEEREEVRMKRDEENAGKEDWEQKYNRLRTAYDAQAEKMKDLEEAQEELRSLSRTYDELSIYSQRKDEEVAALRQTLASVGKGNNANITIPAPFTDSGLSQEEKRELQELRLKNKELTKQVQELNVVVEANDTTWLEEKLEALEKELAEAKQKAQSLEGQLSDEKIRFQTLEAEQDELYICFSRMELEKSVLQEKLASLPV